MCLLSIFAFPHWFVRLALLKLEKKQKINEQTLIKQEKVYPERWVLACLSTHMKLGCQKCLFS